MCAFTRKINKSNQMSFSGAGGIEIMSVLLFFGIGLILICNVEEREVL